MNRKMNISNLTTLERLSLLDGEIINGSKTLESTIVGLIGEAFVASLLNGQLEDVFYYDVVAGDSKYQPFKGDKIEVKSTSRTDNHVNRRTVGSVMSKKGNCDFIALVDLYAETIRCSIIPEKVFFKHAHIVGVSHGGQFKWSGSYNETDKVEVENTKLFLKYEVV